MANENPSGGTSVMKQWFPTVFVALGCTGVGLAAGLSFGARGSDARTVAPAQQVSDRRVRLPSELAQRSGIRTARVTRTALSPTLELVGSVDFDADRVADIGGRISGRITALFVRPGDEVREGTPLAQIESAALGDAIADYLSARANAVAARQNANREIELGQQQLSTARSVEQARAAAAAIEAELRGAEQRLLAMGLTPDEVRALSNGRGSRHVTLRAPIAGRVISRSAVLGQTVESTSTVIRVADLSRVWVLLDVFEKDLARVRVGDRAEIVSETYPHRVFQGTVNYIDATVDTRTRTARVRIEVDNPEQLLRPGQFVTARVRTHGDGTREAITIPRRALVQIEGRPAVFVRVGPQEYEVRTLELGVSDGDHVEVVRGLEEGADLVVEGVFALKSELQR